VVAPRSIALANQHLARKNQAHGRVAIVGEAALHEQVVQADSPRPRGGQAD
jgi:hypothetical protein